MLPPDNITAGEFHGFIDEFRTFASSVNEKIDVIKTDLAEGSTRFALYEQKSIEATKRSDEHSDQIQVLTIDKIQRDTREAQQEKDFAPRNNLVQEIVKTVIIAAILGLLAVSYNLFRDYQSGDLSKTAPPVTPPANP
jgi:hypothetical protein